jgi:hypothetical protein
LPPFQQSPPPAESRSKAPAKNTTPTTNQDRSAIFKRWDANHDNLLTLEEYTQAIRTKDTAPTRFKTFDKIADGHQSEADFVKPVN